MTGARADRPILAAGGLVAVGFVGESDEEKDRGQLQTHVPDSLHQIVKTGTPADANTCQQESDD